MAKIDGGWLMSASPRLPNTWDKHYHSASYQCISHLHGLVIEMIKFSCVLTYDIQNLITKIGLPVV